MLEGLKEKLKERTEKNAAKVELSYTKKDKEGNEELYTELVYLKRSTLPLGDWHRIYPAVDEVTNKINWLNTLIGGKKNFVKLLLLLGMILLAFLAYHELANQYNILASSPCALDCFTKLR